MSREPMTLTEDQQEHILQCQSELFRLSHEFGSLGYVMYSCDPDQNPGKESEWVGIGCLFERYSEIIKQLSDDLEPYGIDKARRAQKEKL